MKRLVAWLSNIAITALLALVALTMFAPQWLPSWARPGFFEPVETEGAEPASAAPAGEPSEADHVDDGWIAARKIAPSPANPRLLPIVRLTSPEVAKEVGLETAAVVSRKSPDVLWGNAESAFDANNYAEIHPRVRGLIKEIKVDEGHMLTSGQVLAVIDSAEVGSAKATYLSVLPVVEVAKATFDRTESLVGTGAMPKKNELESRATYNRARADLLDAEQRLRNLGFTVDQLKEIAAKQDTSSFLNVITPIAGEIVERHAVLGEAVEPTSRLFVVADTRVMWAWIDVYESEIDRVKAGQHVTLVQGGQSPQTFEGHIDWIDPAVNLATRTIRVRAVLANPENRLLANQFGRASIAVGTPRDRVLVPRDAVQELGDAQLVFQPQEDGSYRPQRIEVAPSSEAEMMEATWGLKPGGSVVTTGSFLLMSELRRDELAGD